MPDTPSASEEDLRARREQSYRDALRLSNVVLFELDDRLRHLWIENHPDGLTTEDVVGRSEEEVMPLSVVQQTLAAKQEVLSTGVPHTIEFQWPVGNASRWYELRLEPARSGQGRIIGLRCAAIDISERKQSESHLRVLLLELAHRSKNLLAVIQGISNQTAQTSTTIEEFSRRFSGRLLSLSRAHDILSDQNWRGAGMRELIRTQVLLFAGHAAERVSYEGDAVYLRPNAAQYIGLALYELTVNALKYGALSADDGQVKVRWLFEFFHDRSPAQFTLDWMEEKGPPVLAPEQRHFGRILLEEVVPLSVQGQADLKFHASGIHYRIRMPASELS